MNYKVILYFAFVFLLFGCKDSDSDRINDVEKILLVKINSNYKIVNYKDEGIRESVEEFDVCMNSIDYNNLVRNLDLTKFTAQDSFLYRNIENSGNRISVILYNKSYRIHYACADL